MLWLKKPEQTKKPLTKEGPRLLERYSVLMAHPLA